MASQIRIYRIKEFIRFNESGVIDVERSKQMVHRLVLATTFREANNILLDLRSTTVPAVSMGDLMEVSAEFARYRSAFKGKIANVIPDDPARIRIAKRFKALLDLQSLRYEVFTSFEQAIEWLSEIEEVADNKDAGPPAGRGNSQSGTGSGKKRVQK